MPANFSLAEAFNAPVDLDLLEPEGSFRHAMRTSDKPFLLYEAGEALRFDGFSIRVGVKGVLRVMRKLDMLPPLKTALKNQTAFAYSSYWGRADNSGTILFNKKLGAQVAKGENIAVIASPLSAEESAIQAPKAGIVIGKSNLPLAHQGEALFHIACLDKPAQVADKIAELAALTEMNPKLPEIL